jgi:uncharacterized protein (TIGR02145 family)
MKKLFFFMILVSSMSITLSQNKKLTLYYHDSTRVINIAGLDSMTVFICGASKVKYGGKDYNTVLIGNQCWLKENLDIGTMISSEIHSTNNSIIEKYCYDNLTANCDIYGGLYQWDEVMQYVQTEGAQGICPEGWHIPTLAEFQTLSSTVGGDGNALKAIGQGHDGGAGTNTSGFSALLGGNKEYYYHWTFMHLTMRGHFWSSSLENIEYVHRIWLWDDRSTISPGISPVFTLGFSVRCIKD